MKTLTRYIALGFTTTFLGALVILTFVMSIGVIFKVMDLVARGAPWRPILQIFVYSLPNALMLAIPISALIAALLEFGRLSSDGEVTAMRASGMSSWQIVRSPLVIGVLLMGLCLYVNSEVAPRGHLAQRAAMSQLGLQSPLKLLEEGRFLQDFDGLTVYVGRKRGYELSDVRIYDTRTRGITREIRAKTGTVRLSKDGKDLLIDLFNVRVDPLSDDQPWPASAGQYSMKIENVARRDKYRPKEDDYSMRQLTQYIRDVRSLIPQLRGRDAEVVRTTLSVELNKRLVLAVSCVSFVLLGVPLGIRAHRKESSVGVAISLLLVFLFYLFVIAAESLRKRPELNPDLIIWVPVILCLELGIYLLNRQN